MNSVVKEHWKMSHPYTATPSLYSALLCHLHPHRSAWEHLNCVWRMKACSDRWVNWWEATLAISLLQEKVKIMKQPAFKWAQWISLMKLPRHVRMNLKDSIKAQPVLSSQLDSKKHVINPPGLILEELGGGQLKPILWGLTGHIKDASWYARLLAFTHCHPPLH